MTFSGVISGTFGADGEASFRLNGEELATYRPAQSIKPWFATPLRSRPLNGCLLADSKLKVARARQHLHELDVLVQQYFTSSPFSNYETRDPQTGDDVVLIVVESPLSRLASAVSGDALQNLRSALDLMVCDLIRVNNKSPTANSGFPSSSDPTRVLPKIRGVSSTAEKFLLRLKTIKRWNDPLWLLHNLDNLHKHNRLIAVGAASVHIFAQVHMPFISMTPEGGLRIGAPSGISLMKHPGVPTGVARVFLREGANELYRRKPHLDEELSAEVGVVFGPGEIGEGQDVRETIFQLANLVERIIVICERQVI